MPVPRTKLLCESIDFSILKPVKLQGCRRDQRLLGLDMAGGRAWLWRGYTREPLHHGGRVCILAAVMGIYTWDKMSQNCTQRYTQNETTWRHSRTCEIQDRMRSS